MYTQLISNQETKKQKVKSFSLKEKKIKSQPIYQN